MIQPRGARVLITPLKEDATVQSASGLVRTDEDFKAPQSIKGLVVAVGPDVSDLKIGDTIFCSQFAPTQVKEKPGDNYVILPEEDILGVLSPDGSV